MIFSLIYIFIVYCQTISGRSTPDIFSYYVHTEVGIYKIHTSPATWNEARNICLDEKAHLVVIDSWLKTNMLLKYTKSKQINEFWIGVHDFFEKKSWTTIKDERFRSAHWAEGQPSENESEQTNCVGMATQGLHAWSCQNTKAFICERNDSL